MKIFNLKIILLHIVSLLFLFNLSSNALAEERIIDAPSGLTLRETPDVKGKKITVIPFNEKVNIIEVDNRSITIDSINGNWFKIKWKDQLGWVFSGYLKSVENNKVGIDNFLGIYSSNNFGTWNFYKENDKYFMQNYSATIYANKKYEVTINNISEEELNVNLIYKEDKWNFIFIPENSDIYLHQKFANGRILKPKEYKKYYTNLKNDELLKIINNSEKMSKVKIIDNSYYLSNKNNLYFFSKNFPVFEVVHYKLDSNYKIINTYNGTLYFKGDLLLANINGIEKQYPFKDEKLFFLGYKYRKKLDSDTSNIADSIYCYSHINILKGIGLTQNKTIELKESIILNSKLGTVLINKKLSEVIETVPRYGDGVNGSDGVYIKEASELNSSPDTIKLMVFKMLRDYKTSALLADYEIEVIYNLCK